MDHSLFLRIDRDSVAAVDFQSMESASRVMRIHPEENCFLFFFERVRIDHAMLLFGGNESRFGFDLQHYLCSAQGLFRRIKEGFVVMPNGSPDFKRRFSEDLGVAIGAVFLADSLGLRLETVTQIPTNSRLDKHAKVPDFCGYDNANRKLVFECKGTTSSSDVDKHRQKAKSQLAAHTEANVSKFAIVTYVPTTSKLIPPCIFVSDPPIPSPRLSLAVATGLHLLRVLKFSGIESPIAPLRRMLSTWIKIDERISDGQEEEDAKREEFLKQKKQFKSAMQSMDFPGRSTFRGREFVGTYRPIVINGQSVSVFTGFDLDHVTAVSDALVDGQPASDFVCPRYVSFFAFGENFGEFSVFSDGSLLEVKRTARS